MPQSVHRPGSGPPLHTEGVYARTVRSTPSMRESAKAPFQRTQTKLLGSARGEASEAIPDVGATIGNYVLAAKLGEGAHGAVYRAHRVGLEQHRVALKVIPASAEHMAIVQQELVTLATVVHPNIVQLSDHGSSGSFAWFTMPLYEGAPLDSKLAERFRFGEALDVEEAYEIFLPLAGALAALHAAGFRHQDVKPENIFLGKFADKEHPILLDLGVAVGKDNQKFLAGTREYFAPEQLETFLSHMGLKPRDEGEAPALSEKMDVYALAATLLLAIVGPELVPGAGLFRDDMPTKPLDDTWKEIVLAQRQRETAPIDPRALRGLRGPARRELTQAFQRWFARHPADRPTAAQMAKELGVLLLRRSQAERRRRIVQRGVLGATTLLLVGAPVAYAGGKYAVSLRECKDRVAQDALMSGEVAHNLEDCQLQAAALMQRESACTGSLASEKEERATKEQELDERIAAGKTLGAKLQMQVDGERGKNQVCTAERARGEEREKACNTARTDAEKQLAQTQESLSKTTAERQACAANLGKANGDLAKATAESSRLTGELAACGNAREQCGAELTTVSGQLAACKTEAAALAKCKSDLQTVTTDAAGCKTQVTTCNANAASCQGQLDACKRRCPT